MDRCPVVVPGLMLLLFVLPVVTRAASFVVTTTVDGVDVNPGDGICDSAASPSIVACSLRAAVMESNALLGADTVSLPAGVHLLTISGDGSVDPSIGDLDVVGDLVVEGGDGVILDGNDAQRLFWVGYGATLTVRDAEVRNGLANSGGCFAVSSGALVLERVLVHDCEAGAGGAIHASGALYATDAWIRGNVATFSGGGIASFGFTRLERVTLNGNTAGSGGGLFAGSPGETVLVDVTVFLNASYGSGGGLYLSENPARLYSVSVVDNLCDIDSSGGGAGGGIWALGQPLSVANSVIANNRCGPVTVWSDCYGTVTSGGYNFVGVGTDCGGFAATGDTVGPGPASADPLLQPFGLAGGWAPGREPRRDSPLLDAANPAGCRADRDGSGPGGEVLLAVDQRGARRVSGPACDIGGMEEGTIFADGFEGGNSAAWSLAMP